MAQKVTKAVIAAAGFGTRFLPQTKAMPKEMLPLIDKPIIQYAVEDLVAAGVKDIIIVGSSSKRAIEDHFDVPNEDLLVNIRAGGPKKAHYIQEMEDLANMANFIYVRQKGPYGNATPIANAAHLIGDEPFIFVYADDLVVSEPNTFTQMVDLYNRLGGSIATCMRVKTEKEYLFEPSVLKYIESGLKNLPAGDEFYVVNSLVAPMLADGHNFFGCVMENSRRYDTGDKLEYLITVVEFALRHKDLGPAFREHVEKLLKES